MLNFTLEAGQWIEVHQGIKSTSTINHFDGIPLQNSSRQAYSEE